MHKYLSANFIKKIKKEYKRKLVKDIKIFLNEKKEKSHNMVVKVTKFSQKIKKNKKQKKLVEQRKKYFRMTKSTLL